MNNKVTCLIIDDEPIGREIIEAYVGKIPFMELAGAYSKPMEALEFLKKSSVDILFTDIEMPNLNGIALINSLPRPPLTILITAFKEYAFDGFDSGVVDYLIKPVSFERFLKAVNKARELLAIRKSNAPNEIFKDADDRIFIKSDSKLVKISFEDIVYIEALKDYLRIHISEKERYVTYSTMKAMEQKLPAGFFRIHRSYIINTKYIKSFYGNTVKLSFGGTLPISAHLRPALFLKLGINES